MTTIILVAWLIFLTFGMMWLAYSYKQTAEILKRALELWIHLLDKVNRE